MLGVFKSGIGIGASDLNDLEVVLCGALGGGRISILEDVGCLPGRHLRFLVGVLGLSDALLSSLPKCLIGLDGSSGEFIHDSYPSRGGYRLGSRTRPPQRIGRESLQFGR